MKLLTRIALTAAVAAAFTAPQTALAAKGIAQSHETKANSALHADRQHAPAAKIIWGD